MSEVLGLKSYLCPKPLFALRSLKGGGACSVLNVLFKPLFSPQSHLLEKVMSSVDIVDFSCLEVKNLSFLEQIFRFEEGERPADLVCFFGGELEGQKEWIQKRGGKELVQAQGQIQAQGQTAQPPPFWFFIQTVGLEELSGNSASIRENKIALWNKLRQWKSLRQKP